MDALLHFLMSISSGPNAPVGADLFRIEAADGNCIIRSAARRVMRRRNRRRRSLRADVAAKSPTSSDPALAVVKKMSVPVGDLARKTTVPGDGEVLMNPQEICPSGRMPSLNLNETEATAIATFSCATKHRAGDTNVPSPRVRGLSYQYFEGNFARTAAVEASPVKDTGFVDQFRMTPRKRPENVGLRFTGFVNAPSGMAGSSRRRTMVHGFTSATLWSWTTTAITRRRSVRPD